MVKASVIDGFVIDGFVIDGFVIDGCTASITDTLKPSITVKPSITGSVACDASRGVQESLS